MKITLTGDLGSGKSAVSRILCAKTGYDYISTGQLQRQLAAELGLDTLELNQRSHRDFSFDQKIDSIFVDLVKDPQPYIIDSRMAWFFLPDAFKVYLSVALDEAVRRILADPHRKSEEYTTAEEAKEKIIARKTSENQRYWKIYGADCTNMHHFDLVVDTTQRQPDEVAQLILQAVEFHTEGVPFPRFV